MEKKSMQSSTLWAQRRDVPVTILAWIIVGVIFFWLISHIARTILLFAVAAILSYGLSPIVSYLQKFMNRTVAILFVYVVVFSFFAILLYIVTISAVSQLNIFIHSTLQFLTPQGQKHETPLLVTLENMGVSKDQIGVVGQQLTTQAEQLTSSIIPILGSVFAFVLDMLVVAIVSIYLLIDGEKIRKLVRNNTPSSQKHRLQFLFHTFDRIIGGYVRGQLLLTVVIGLLVGIGMTLFHVPYALLLGVLAFILEFIPVLGTLISGAICILLAITQGWVIAVLVLIYFIIVHIIEGDILGPRIVGKAVGIHPLVSIFALIAGSELFGIVGALFAAPIAGLIQAFVSAAVSEWRETHQESFPSISKK